LKTCESLYRNSCRDCDEDRLREEGNYTGCGNYTEISIPLIIPISRNGNGHNPSLDITKHLTLDDRITTPASL
jgi:hypothetical protein